MWFGVWLVGSADQPNPKISFFRSWRRESDRDFQKASDFLKAMAPPGADLDERRTLMTLRQIIAMGGGGFSMEPDNLALDRYVLAQANVKRPAVCFLPTASGDADLYVLNFYKAFSTLDCQPAYLSLFRPPTADLEGYLLAQNVIYVGGGNTRNMLVLWREWGLDAILRKAYEAGIVLAGISAGANCWFEQCSTDSVPGALGVLPGLGFLPGGFCPHYDGEAERRPSLHRFVLEDRIPPTYAAENSAAVHFVDERLVAALSSMPDAKVYRVAKVDGQVVEAALEMKYLLAEA
jgi:dipeptidase E